MAKRIDLDKALLKKLYYEEWLSIPKISKKLKVSVSCVENNFKRYGLQFKGMSERHLKKKDIELHKQGKWHCWKCNKTKNISEFTLVEKYWMGHAHICKSCSTQRRRQWRKDNPWKQRAYYINKRAGVKFVTPEDLKEIWDKYKGKCYYCDKKLDYATGSWGLEFDHVINGLQKSNNLVTSCRRCNTLKGNVTLEELKNFVEKIEQFIKKAM